MKYIGFELINGCQCIYKDNYYFVNNYVKSPFYNTVVIDLTVH